MSQPPVVSNSSAIIALDRIGQLDLLSELFTQLIRSRPARRGRRHLNPELGRIWAAHHQSGVPDGRDRRPAPAVADSAAGRLRRGPAPLARRMPLDGRLLGFRPRRPAKMERDPEYNTRHPGPVQPPAGPLQGVGLEPAAAVGDKRKCPEEQDADWPKHGLTARRICGFHRVRPRPPYWFCYNGSMSTAIEKTHIEMTPGICGGRPRIAGHRIRVQDIVLWTEEGLSPDEIVVRFPQLSLADVHAALAHYHDHREEIDQQIREDREFISRLRSENGPGLLDRLRGPALGNPVSS